MTRLIEFEEGYYEEPKVVAEAFAGSEPSSSDVPQSIAEKNVENLLGWEFSAS